MATLASSVPFDLAEATRWLGERDERLKRLIAETRAFELAMEEARSPYEALLRSIAYQSISGKAAATIFARVRARGGNGRVPSPAQMLTIRNSALSKAGPSTAKVLPMQRPAQTTIAGIAPTLAQAH